MKTGQKKTNTSKRVAILLRNLALTYQEFTWHEIRELFAETDLDLKEERLQNAVTNMISSLRQAGMIERTETRGRYRSLITLTPDQLDAHTYEPIG